MTRRSRYAPTPAGRALAIVEALEAVAFPAGHDYSTMLDQLDHPIAAEAEAAWLALGKITGLTITDPDRQLVLSTLQARLRTFGPIVHSDIAPLEPTSTPRTPTAPADVFAGLPRS